MWFQHIETYSESGLQEHDIDAMNEAGKLLDGLGYRPTTTALRAVQTTYKPGMTPTHLADAVHKHLDARGD